MNYSKLTIELTKDEEYRVRVFTGFEDDDPLFEKVYSEVRFAGMTLTLDGALLLDARGSSPELNEVSARISGDDEEQLNIEQQTRDQNAIVVESHEV